MTAQDNGDFFMYEGVDFASTDELHRVVGHVNALLAPQGKALSVTVLSAEQWKHALAMYLPQSVRLSAQRYTHVLRNRRQPQNLLISPDAISGINARQRTSYQELVYALLRCVATPLEGVLRRGVDDVVAKACSVAINVEFFCNTSPEEAELIALLTSTLTVEYSDFKYSQKEWALELRRNPQRVLKALMKTKYGAYLLSRVKENPELSTHLPKEPAAAKNAIIAMLIDPKLKINDTVFSVLNDSMQAYASWSAQNPRSRGKQPIAP